MNTVTPAWEVASMNRRGMKNPPNTGAIRNAYDRGEFSIEETLVREATQNSRDAGLNSDGVTTMRVQKLVFSGESKEELIKLLHLDTLLGPRVEVFRSSPRNKALGDRISALFESDRLNALLIRDYNTCGLGGRLDSFGVEDHFSRLLYAHNLDDKPDAVENGGGSFGMGKVCYSMASKIDTVLYNTVIEPGEDNDHHYQRAMATAILPLHRIGDEQYGGFGYFGPSIEDPADSSGDWQTPVTAFANEEAEALWAKVSELAGCDLIRTKDQIGTDMLILEPDINFDLLKPAFEDYYFPSLIDDDPASKINIELANELGELLPGPDPFQREDLKPFVTLYKKIAMERVSEEKSDDLVIQKFRRIGKEDGTFLEVGTHGSIAAPLEYADDPKNHRIAFTRRTGMILFYHNIGAQGYLPGVGMFVVHELSKKIALDAENHSHSRLSLTHKIKDRGPEYEQLITAMNKRPEDALLSFLRNLQAPVEKSRSGKGLFSELISRAFSKKNAPYGPVPEEELPRPVSLHPKHIGRSENKSVWELEIRDSEHTPNEPFEITVVPTFSVKGERGTNVIKMKEVEIKDEKRRVIQRGTKASHTFTYSPGNPVKILVETANPGKQNLQVEFKCISRAGERRAALETEGLS